MKTIKLVFSRLLSDFMRNKMMMILYLIGSVLCILVFIYFYNNIQVLIQEYQIAQQNIFVRQYKVTLNEPTNITENSFNFLKEYDIENIGLSAYIQTDEQNIHIETFSSNKYLKDLKISSVKHSNNTYIEFTEEQMKQNILIVNEKDYYKDNKCIINNNEFVIIKSNAYNTMIPLNSFISNNFYTSEITITVPQRLDNNTNLQFIELLSTNLQKFCSVSNIVNPHQNENSDIHNDIIFEIGRLCLIYIIGFIGCAVLFKYIFDMNRYENIIYSLVGASKKRVVFIILFEALIISLISIIISIGLHIALYDCFFSLINRSDIKYTVNDYLIISCFSVVLSFIILIPFFISYIKKPIIHTKTKYR